VNSAALRLADDGQRAMPRKFPFTLAKLERVTCPAGKPRVWVYDTHTANLAYTVTSSGGRAFYWYGRQSGKPVRERLGGVELSVDDARAAAVRVSFNRSQGISTHQAKQAAKREATFGEVFEQYIEQHSKPNKRTWREDEQKYELHLKKPLAGRRMKDITRQDIVAIHQKISRTSPGAANRNLALLSKIFNWSKSIGIDVGNPTEGVPRNRENQRDRFLSPDELRRFLASCKGAGEPWSDLFPLLLFTGGRWSNVAGMEWAELDIDAAQWRIPPHKFKSSKAQVVHLTKPAVEILSRRNKARAQNGPSDSLYVFPSTRSVSGHVDRPQKAWGEVTEAAGLEGVNIHDLRRTAGSWMAASGANLSVISKSLGHATIQTTTRYARMDLSPVKAAMDTAAAAMLKASRKRGKKDT
jgi:integrase